MLNIELFQQMNFRPIIIQRIVLVAHKTKLATHRFQIISTQEKKKKRDNIHPASHGEISLKVLMLREKFRAGTQSINTVTCVKFFLLLPVIILSFNLQIPGLLGGV